MEKWWTKNVINVFQWDKCFSIFVCRWDILTYFLTDFSSFLLNSWSPLRVNCGCLVFIVLLCCLWRQQNALGSFLSTLIDILVVFSDPHFWGDSRLWCTIKAQTLQITIKIELTIFQVAVSKKSPWIRVPWGHWSLAALFSLICKEGFQERTFECCLERWAGVWQVLKGFRCPVGPWEDGEHLTHIPSLYTTGQGPQWDWADRDGELMKKMWWDL